MKLSANSRRRSTRDPVGSLAESHRCLDWLVLGLMQTLQFIVLC